MSKVSNTKWGKMFIPLRVYKITRTEASVTYRWTNVCSCLEYRRKTLLKSHRSCSFTECSMLTEESVYLITDGSGSLKTVILPFKLLSNTCCIVCEFFDGFYGCNTHCDSLTTAENIEILRQFMFN